MSVRVEKTSYIEKRLYWNTVTCSCENGKYLSSIIDNSVITCDKIIDAEANSYDKETSFNTRKAACKTLNFYIFVVFPLIIIVLLITVCIYYYLIKYQVKQKHLLLFHIINNELKQVTY